MDQLRCSACREEHISSKVSQVIAQSRTSPSKKWEVHVCACGCHRSIVDIDWLLKARLKALNRQWQALAPVRHYRSTPAARFWAYRKRKKKSRNRTFRQPFEIISLFILQWTLNLQGSVPTWDRRHTSSWWQIVAKNEDNVHSHLPYISPIVDHTFVWGGREGVECHMKVLSFVRNVRTFEMTPNALYSFKMRSHFFVAVSQRVASGVLFLSSMAMEVSATDANFFAGGALNWLFPQTTTRTKGLPSQKNADKEAFLMQYQPAECSNGNQRC